MQTVIRKGSENIILLLKKCQWTVNLDRWKTLANVEKTLK